MKIKVIFFVFIFLTALISFAGADISDKADLYIKDMDITDWAKLDGNVTIGNCGTKDLNTPYTVKAEILVDDKWQPLIKTKVTNPLPAGETEDVSLLDKAQDDPDLRDQLMSASKIRISIDGDHRVIEKNENNNIGEFEISPPKPDLSVASVEIADWDQLSGTATVKNTGIVPTYKESNVKVDVYTDGKWQTISNITLSPMDPGDNTDVPILDQAQYSDDAKDKLMKASKIRVSVDSANTVLEKNEKDNVKIIPVSPPKPDLRVNDIFISDWDSMRGIATITNDSVASSRRETSARVDVFADGKWQKLTTIEVPVVAAGETVNVPVFDGVSGDPALKSLLARSSKIRLFVDGNNKVEEKDENNNSKDINISSSGADLCVQSITIINLENLDAYATIENIGDEEVVAPYHVTVEVFAGGAWQAVADKVISSKLSADKYVNVPLFDGVKNNQAAKQLVLKALKLRVKADLNNVVDERSENNNCKTVDLK